ncbi:MAG: SMC-Scp complex subunit ScpB [SAR324 cluster bacterium]|nr:SMC-Scp complex subunit ScpB [SAR324 cluster bacterium]
MKAKEQEQVIEAILFSSPQAISLRQVSELMGTGNSREFKKLIENLNRQYEKSGRVFRIREVAGGFQMRTEPRFRPWIKKLEPIKPIKLSLPTIETLAIVAYKQPITRANVEFIRGVDSSYTLRTLLQRNLIRIVGKEPVPGRPILYGTTKFFLEVFGLSNLNNLPSLAELDMVRATEEEKDLAEGHPESEEFPGQAVEQPELPNMPPEE